MNKCIIAGLLINGIIIIAKRFTEIPDNFACFGTGLSFPLLMLGIYFINHDMTKMRNFKKTLMKKFASEK